MRTIFVAVFICTVVATWAYPAAESKPEIKNATLSLIPSEDFKLNGTLLPGFNETGLLGAGDRESRVFWPYWGTAFGPYGAYGGYGYGYGPFYRGGYPGPGYFWG